MRGGGEISLPKCENCSVGKFEERNNKEIRDKLRHGCPQNSNRIGIEWRVGY